MTKVDLGQWWNPFTWFKEITVKYGPPLVAESTIANIRPWNVSQVTPPPPEAAATIAVVAAKVAPKRLIDWKKVAPYALGVGIVIVTVLLLRREK